MGRNMSCIWNLILIFVSLLTNSMFSDCYDPLDPNGNITITFDILQWTDDGYLARVTLQNYYQYRHVEKPGWSLGWTWARDEVIWSMAGGMATQRGNCSMFKSQIPHSCKKNPLIVDLMPDARSENMSDGCCHGGLLSAWGVEPSKSFSSFAIKVGNLAGNYTAYRPLNITLMAPGPGYTCGPLFDTDPTVSSVVGGRREEEVLRTWKSTCTYSSYLASKTPICCVSLSSFYNPAITSCPMCSCGCKEADSSTKSCIREGSSTLSSLDMVQCTDHMCPLRVHWHIKNNYRDHWRVKMTVSNYNYGINYSNWNVLVHHPGFSQVVTTYSFNSSMLPTAGVPDEVALFWGIEYFNTLLLQADEKQVGSVASEVLLTKDLKSFTLRNGWAFPRRVYFNGENCEMPLPDSFPVLPNVSSNLKPPPSICHIVLLLIWLTYRAFVSG